MVYLSMAIVVQLVEIATSVLAIIRDELRLTLDKVDKEVMGHSAKVVFTKDSMTIVGDGSTHDAQVAEQEYKKEKRNDRIEKLFGGGVIIQITLHHITVGAQTETEQKEKKLRLERQCSIDFEIDILAVVEEGNVVVGGCTLLRFASKVDAIKDRLENDEEKLEQALSFPLKLIAKNAGANGSVVSDKVVSNDNLKFGYNAATGEYEELMAAGIIDLTKVSSRDK
ncbi:hypothetical protein RHSIM_Rhsim08G0134500 [Rhododendron simsii]|uniref:Uncharacterized protein n=1 Tax=Rhododendron simsii TaxID=118357 RepID=A0A834GK35_RHOSS|nr:hypothetical protein RHSIM_Rhsim08G0134500 [Rhododendron simsii]